MVLGIDEAGRGPVIGPMIISGVLIEENKISDLIEIGVKDSKELSRKKREEIFEKLIKLVEKYEYILIDPKTIDYYVYKNKLNYLEINNMINIIKKLRPDKVYIDSPSRNTKKIEEYIKNHLDYNPILIVDVKADKKYPIVSAASIISKVIRDKKIDEIKEKTGIDIGSGYPSDPKTIKAIEEYYDILKDYIRESWSTIKKIKEKKQRNISEFL